MLEYKTHSFLFRGHLVEISLEEYKKTIESGSNMTKTDSAGILTYVNDEFCKTMGYSKKELIGKTHSVIKHPDNPSEIFKQLWDIIKSKQIYDGIIKNLTKDKKTIYLRTLIYPITDDNDEIIGYISNRFDVTEEILLKERENLQNKKIEESEKKLIMSQKIAHMGYWDLDFKNNKLFWSDEIYNIFNIKAKSMEPSYELFLDLIHPGDKQMVKNAFENAVKNKTFYHIIHRLLMPNGSIKWVEENGETTYNEKGEPLSTMGTVQDITQRYLNQQKIKEQELLLQQKSKMETMGEMIEIISHQWRQPLSIISSIVMGIQLKIELNKMNNDYLLERSEKISDSVNYLSQTINDFKDFFNSKMIKTTFTVSSMVDKTIKILNLELEEIEIVKEFDDINITSYENQLMQVLMNLINNSRDEFKRQDLDKAIIIIKAYEKDDTLYFEVCDNARGVPQNIINNVFNHYFTTKDKKGTGLGLSMVKEIIIKSFQGTIHVENSEFVHNKEKYNGAKFVISFPKGQSKDL